MTSPPNSVDSGFYQSAVEYEGLVGLGGHRPAGRVAVDKEYKIMMTTHTAKALHRQSTPFLGHKRGQKRL